MKRRMTFGVLAAALAASATAQQSGQDGLRDLLAESQNLKKGVTLYVNGQTIAMIVTKLGQDYVEGRNQQHSKIVVRLTSIEAAAMA